MIDSAVGQRKKPLRHTAVTAVPPVLQLCTTTDVSESLADICASADKKLRMHCKRNERIPLSFESAGR